MEATYSAKIFSANSIDQAITVAEQFTEQLKDMRYSRHQLDKEYVAYTEHDMVCATYIMIIKFPAVLTEIAILMQHLLSQNCNGEAHNTSYAVHGRWINKPEVNQVYMLSEEPTEYQPSLPVELDIDIEPFVNGRKWKGMILDSGLTTSDMSLCVTRNGLKTSIQMKV